MRKALFTTNTDLSVDYFFNHNWDIYTYNESSGTNTYDVVYFRDPFNDKNLITQKEEMDSLIRRFKNSKIIDSTLSYQDMIDTEDKLNQYKIYGDFMPKTFLPSNTQFVPGEYIAKKRISQRAKDIIFEIDHPLNDDWIYQELLEIKEELRVYAVFKRPQATIKTSKAFGKVKVIGGRKLKNEEIKFAEEIAKMSSLDFIGMDIAVLKNGNLKLIEVNRSPQFKRFAELYGEDYFSPLLDI